MSEALANAEDAFAAVVEIYEESGRLFRIAFR